MFKKNIYYKFGIFDILVVLYKFSILGGFFVSGIIFLFYELIVEFIYLVVEGIIVGVLIIINNIFIVIFLFVLMVFKVGK